MCAFALFDCCSDVMLSHKHRNVRRVLPTCAGTCCCPGGSTEGLTEINDTLVEYVGVCLCVCVCVCVCVCSCVLKYVSYLVDAGMTPRRRRWHDTDLCAIDGLLHILW